MYIYTTFTFESLISRFVIVVMFAYTFNSKFYLSLNCILHSNFKTFSDAAIAFINECDIPALTYIAKQCCNIKKKYLLKNRETLR